MKIIALMGKAGSGKDTLLKEIITKYPNRFNEIISCTTRPPREGEVHGVNYYFISRSEFIDLIYEEAMLEYTDFNSWLYGTSIDSLSKDKINIGVFNPAGIKTIAKNKDIELEVYYLRAPAKERLLRQLNREENPDVQEIVRRFSADEADFADLSDVNYIPLDNIKKEDVSTLADFIVGWSC